ncbi:TonB-dependent receptor [Massilia sp. TW-1]|uniref:TonB-dependent receptor n=1 Tax=Telluria antibiotica TaxID=2717319 RepID=A0ABX0PI39_9BURK|nr:TonB-dependent receptor [Telluria antibiotica]NIA56959.1 TonB-dependent receptor [Telluria antibiotica]
MLDQASFKKTGTASAVAAFLAIQCGAALAQTAATDDRGTIQEVFVTAQRISQSASKTPISLSVLSGDDLKAAGAVNASNLTELVPNVQISNNGGATVISIRGVSSADNTEKGDPSAAFNVDGVYYARPQSAGLAFYDLERIEVLRGPQGTLYGRNATAGAINLITNKPVDRFESSAAVEFGNYHDKKFDGMLNSKVNDILSVRAAVSSVKHDGYLRSTQGFATDYDDDDSISGRVHALFKLSPDISLLLSADKSTRKGAGPGNVPYNTFIGKSADAQRTATPSVQGDFDSDAHGASAELKVNTRVGEITYLGAHRSLFNGFTSAVGQAIAGVLSTYTLANADLSQTSHELRLASKFGSWRTIGGLYWFHEQSIIDGEFRNFPGAGALIFLSNPAVSRSKAAFGEATYSVTPKLNVTAGLRRTNDDKSRKGYTVLGDPEFFRSVNDAAVSYSQTTGRIGFDYALAHNTMAYATLSTGYKAGGFNDGTASTNAFLKYDPEHLTSLEVGVKGRFLENHLQVNADVFKYGYKDLQLTAIVVDPFTGANASQTVNAAKASISGAEIEGKYLASSDDKINFSATYLDAHFKSYHPTATVDWAGYRLEKSPRFTFGLHYSHSFLLDGGASLSATAGTRYSASYVLSDYGNGLQFNQGAYHMSDASLTYAPADDKWLLQAYVRNIENNAIMTSYSASFAGFPATVGLGTPRTAGVRLSAYF